jgi:hypothetical protein
VRALSAARILKAWERGRNRSSVEKALALLSAALPERSAAELADLSLGERDVLLLELRERTLGTDLKGYTECPQCRVVIDFTLLVDDVRVGLPLRREEHLVTAEGFEVRFRIPTSRDLGAAQDCRSVEEARALLLRRCVLSARRGDSEIDAASLPESVAEEIAAHIEADDPQAEMPLSLSCAACSHQWLILLDIAAFFWSELSALAERLLYDVHTLARFYGWSEADILAMSAARRQFYLNQATAR